MSQIDLDLFVWTPIMEGYATLNEMRTLYDLEDVFDMNLAISLKAEVNKRINSKD